MYFKVKYGKKTVYEDIPIHMKVTFKDGEVITDDAILKIRHTDVFFDSFDLSVVTRNPVNKATGYVSSISDSSYESIEGARSVQVNLLHGIILNDRIKDTVRIESSDTSVVEFQNRTVDSGESGNEHREFFCDIKSAGNATITAYGTDDSGIERTATVTITVVEKIPMTDCEVVVVSGSATGDEQDGFTVTKGELITFGFTNIVPSNYNAGGYVSRSGHASSSNTVEVSWTETGEKTVNFTFGYEGTTLFTKSFAVTVIESAQQ